MRVNTYGEKLKPQELRNAKWFGEFKSCVYTLAKEFSTFLSANRVFTAKQILRMAEAEFISELLLAMHEGIREGNKKVIDNAYKDYDDEFENRKRHEKRFRETIDVINGILGASLPTLEFRAARLFYPLFCAIYHMKFGLPRLSSTRHSLNVADYPKLKNALEEVDDLIEKIETAQEADEDIDVSSEDRKFFDAYNEHWVHATNRTILTSYLCKQLAKALK